MRKLLSCAVLGVCVPMGLVLLYICFFIVRCSRDFSEVQSAESKSGSPSHSSPLPKTWETKSETNRIDGVVTYSFYKDSDDILDGEVGKVRPYLVIKCVERKSPEVAVSMGVQPEVEYGEYQKHHVRLKLDSGKIESQAWNAATSGYALFYDGGSPRTFLKRMMSSKVLLFEFEEFQRGKHQISFNLDGLDTALAANKKACGL